MNLKKFTLALVVVGGCTLPVMAGHGHHHKENDGVRLAAEIIGLVGAVLNPQPTTVVAKSGFGDIWQTSGKMRLNAVCGHKRLHFGSI